MAAADLGVVRSGPVEGPAFYFDLASPEAYLSAERILTLMPVAVEWIPIHLGAAPDVDRAAFEALAAERGLQQVRWPQAFPFDAALANAAATYAKQIGRTVAFALAAFRQAYAGARDLSVADNVVIAGSACEMHPTATLKAVTTRGVQGALSRATDLARERGVLSTPAVWTGARVLHGDAALEQAAVELSASAPR